MPVDFDINRYDMIPLTLADVSYQCKFCLKIVIPVGKTYICFPDTGAPSIRASCWFSRCSIPVFRILELLVLELHVGFQDVASLPS